MRNNRAIILQAFLILFGAQFLSGNSSTDAFKTASFMEKQGAPEQAISIYKEILDNDPKNTQAYQKLKGLYRRLEQYPQLLLLIQEHYNLFPNDLQSYGELGEVEFLNDNITSADNIWQDLELRFNNSQNTYRILMYVFIRLSLLERAESVVMRGRENLQNPSLLSLDLANYYKNRRIFDKAAEEFLLYLINNPRQKKMITDRILHMSDEEDAMLFIEEKILSKIENNELVIRNLVASFYFKTREYSRAFEQHLALGLNTQEDLVRWIGFSDNLRQEGVDNLAIKSYEIILSANFKIKNTKLLGQALLGLGLTLENKIIPSQQKGSLIQYFPYNEFFENHYYENLDLSKESIKTASQFYDSLLIHLPVSSLSSSAHFRLGEIQYRITKDFDGASKSYEAALKSNPNIKQENKIRLRIGDVLIAKGDIQSARTYFERERNRGAKFLNRLIRVNFLSGNPDSAIILINAELANLHSNVKSFNDLLELRDFIQQHYLLGNNNDQEAFKIFTTSEFLTYQNKLSESADLLHYIQRQFPQSSIIPITILREALVRKAMAQTSLALNLAEKLKQTINADIGCILYAEIIETSGGDLGKALDLYHKFLEDYPSSLLYEPVRFHARNLHNRLEG